MFQVKRPLTSRFEHIWTQDPAIDTEHDDYSVADYMSSGDPKHLPLKEGHEATVFVLQPLSRGALTAAMELWTSGHQLLSQQEAVAYGLVEIKNGGDVELKFDPKAPHGKRLKAATLDAIYHPGLFAELSARLIEQATLHPLSARG